MEMVVVGGGGGQSINQAQHNNNNNSCIGHIYHNRHKHFFRSVYILYAFSADTPQPHVLRLLKLVVFINLHVLLREWKLKHFSTHLHRFLKKKKKTITYIR